VEDRRTCHNKFGPGILHMSSGWRTSVYIANKRVATGVFLTCIVELAGPNLKDI
jgi:hypothetical protein